MEHFIVFVPGLGDNAAALSFVTKGWASKGLRPVICTMEWCNSEEFNDKLERLLRKIDDLSCNGNRVSLVGCSAGASIALNAFLKRKNAVHKVISVCGRLSVGNYQGFRSLPARAKGSPAFEQSVRIFSRQANLLGPDDRMKIMTVRARFGDELVPDDTSQLPGACNIQIPTIEHSLSIVLALSVFSRRLIEFLQG